MLCIVQCGWELTRLWKFSVLVFLVHSFLRVNVLPMETQFCAEADTRTVELNLGNWFTLACRFARTVNEHSVKQQNWFYMLVDLSTKYNYHYWLVWNPQMTVKRFKVN